MRAERGGAALTAEEQVDAQAGIRQGRSRATDARPVNAGRRPLALLAGVAVFVLALDAGTKAIAVAELSGGREIPLAGGLLTLNLVHNSGAAFGIAADYTAVLTLLATGVVALVVLMARKLRSRAWAVAFGLLLGGALGNLADRFFREPGFLRGQVVDFLQVPNWPVFNLADTSVCCAAGLIVLFSLRGRHLDGTREGRPGAHGDDFDEPVAADDEPADEEAAASDEEAARPPGDPAQGRA